jgi:hypothetical protein
MGFNRQPAFSLEVSLALGMFSHFIPAAAVPELFFPTCFPPGLEGQGGGYVPGYVHRDYVHAF